ncbi:hypothetical protein CVT25_006592, partial [Psilocybe cyanescens]
MIAIKRMCVLSTSSFFLTTTISPFPFSLRCLALFTAAVVTVVTIPHPPQPFLPCDGLVITVCEADWVAAASPLLKIGREGDLGGTREGGADPRVDGARHWATIAATSYRHLRCCQLVWTPHRATLLHPSVAATSPAPLTFPAHVAPTLCHPAAPLWPPRYLPPQRCQLMWPPHHATPLHPSVAATSPAPSMLPAHVAPPIVPPCRTPLAAALSAPSTLPA